MRSRVADLQHGLIVTIALASAGCDRKDFGIPNPLGATSDASVAASAVASAAPLPNIGIQFDGSSTTVPRGTLRSSIAFEAMSACSIDASSTVHCFGRRPTDLEPIEDHGAVRFYGATVALAGTSDAMCALSSTGRVECMGRGASGQMGDGALVDHAAPSAVLEGAVEIAAGYAHICARTGDGRLSCWGSDVRALDGGAVVHKCDDGPCLPQPVFFPLKSAATAIYAGPLSICAIEKEGSVECFGSPKTPKNIPPSIRDLALGGSSACALAKSGEVWCWGKNDVSQTGVSGPDVRTDAVRVPLKEKAVEIAAAGVSTCTRLVSGAVQCWGANALGQLGRGSITPGVGLSPGAVALPSGARALVGGGAFCAATDRGVSCWGPRPWTAEPAKSITDPSLEGRDYSSKPVDVPEFAGAR